MAAPKTYQQYIAEELAKKGIQPKEASEGLFSKFFDSLEQPQIEPDAKDVPEWANNPLLGNPATAAASAVDSALFGIPSWAAKKYAPGVARALAAMQDKYKAADVVGDVGSLFIPTGGILAKGLGKGAQVAKLGKVATAIDKGSGLAGTLSRAGQVIQKGDTAYDIAQAAAAGTKTAPTLLRAIKRGALAGAEQVVPRVLTDQMDLGEGAGTVALSAGLGGAGHVVGEGIRRLPESLTSLRKWGTKTMLKRADINQRDLRAQARNYLGNDGDRVEGFMKKAAEEVRDGQLYREPLMDAYTASVKKSWRDWSNSWMKAAEDGDARTTITDLLERATKDPDAVNAMARLDARAAANPRVTTTSAKVLKELAAQVDATPGIFDKRKYLADLAFGDTTNPETKIIARAMRDGLDEQARAISGIDEGAWTKMKKDYPLKDLLQKGDVRDETSLAGAGLARGSDTAAKLALSGLGATIGGAAGGSSQIKGLIDDPTNPQSWSRFLAATAGGSVVGATTRGISNALARIAMRMDPEDITNLAKKIGAEKTIEGIKNVITPFASHLEEFTPAAAKLAAQTLEGASDGNSVNFLGQDFAISNNLPNAALGEAPSIMDALTGERKAGDAADVPRSNSDSYLDFVEGRLWNRFVKSGQASRTAQWASINGQDPNEVVARAYEDFLGKAYRATGGFETDAVTPYLFSEEKDMATFQRIAKLSLPTLLDTNTLKTAVSYGVFGGARAPEEAMSNILIALDAAGVPSSLGGTPIRKYVDNILRINKKNPNMQKAALIMLIKNQSTLAPNVIDAAFAAGGLL